MARKIPVEDEEIKSQGGCTQESSKYSHVTASTRDDSLVVYENNSYKMAEQVGVKTAEIRGNRVELITLRGLEVRSEMDGEGRGTGDKEENGKSDWKEETAKGIVTQLQTARRRKMVDGGAEVAGSTKGEEDSGKSVDEKRKDEEEKGKGVVPVREVAEIEMVVEGQNEDVTQQKLPPKKASPKRKHQRRPRWQVKPQPGAMMNSGVFPLLLLFTSICMPVIQCKPVMERHAATGQLNLSCAIFNDTDCIAPSAMYCNNVKIWTKKVQMQNCSLNHLEPGLPCQDGGRVIVRLDEGCQKIDMEGCGGRIDYDKTVCPRFEEAQDKVQNDHQHLLNTTFIPPSDENTIMISGVVCGILGVLGLIGGAFVTYWLVKRRNLKGKDQNKETEGIEFTDIGNGHLNSGTIESGETDVKDGDDGTACSNPLLQDRLGQ